MMVTLFQQRGTSGRPGLSLISVYISQTAEGDRGVPIDTGCRAQLTSRFCEAPRWVRAAEPPIQAGAGRDNLCRGCFLRLGWRLWFHLEQLPEVVNRFGDGH
jgi:hypothetical protein